MVSSGTEQEIVLGYIAGDRDSRAGVEKAVKDVNRRSDLLPNFTLKPISLLVDPVVRWLCMGSGVGGGGQGHHYMRCTIKYSNAYTLQYSYMIK